MIEGRARETTVESAAAGSLAPEIARGIAVLHPGDLAPESLMLPLSVSLLLRRARSDLRSARAAMLEVRRAVIEASALDRATEPVPLLAGDERTVVLHLGIYLDGLIDRAAAAGGLTRSAIVEHALGEMCA
jgi:hypothetical protein